jgi:hypothetical protein
MIFAADEKGTSKSVRRVFYLIEDKKSRKRACPRWGTPSGQRSFSNKKREERIK